MQSPDRDEGAGVPYQIQYRLRPADAEAGLWVEDTGRWYAGPDGRPVRAHGVVRLINERRAREERLAYLSMFDALTGEMNRTHLAEALGTAVEETLRYRSGCCFLIVAIDNLTVINDAYGYAVGDEVIVAVSKLVRARLRGGDLLGRLSGNKLGVILRNCTPDDMAIAADRLLAGIRDEVVQTSSAPIAATATIGGVCAPRHARSVLEIMTRAQEALAAAKAKRRGSFLAYRPSVEREMLRRENVRSTDEIVAALNERRIVMAFEPVIAARTREPAFYESLMRIVRPDGSTAVAGEVIPIAERLGLVRLIDHRMIELVVPELAAVPDLRLSLNVSPASTLDPDWWASLRAHLHAHPDVSQRLIIEITESASIQDLSDATGFIARVKDLGCRIAIDDFGAGFTSFRTLRQLGVDLLKIDGAFVQNITRSPDDRAFVRAMIDLARSLGISTVAEWVQDEEAAAMLAQWGCDYLQGALAGLASTERPWAAAPRPVASTC